MFQGSLVDPWVLHTALQDPKMLRLNLWDDCPGYRRTYLHGVGFSRACLSVCKYADVIAIDAGRNQRLDLLKHLMDPIKLLQMLS